MSEARWGVLREGASAAGERSYGPARHEDVAVLEPGRGTDLAVLTDLVLSAGRLLTERRLSTVDRLTERVGRMSAGRLCDRIVPSTGLLIDLRTLSVVRTVLVVLSAGRLIDLRAVPATLLTDLPEPSMGRLADRLGGSETRPVALPPMGSINRLLAPAPLVLSGVRLTDRETGRPEMGWRPIGLRISADSPLRAGFVGVLSEEGSCADAAYADSDCALAGR